jgi:hypothetical protein
MDFRFFNPIPNNKIIDTRINLKIQFTYYKTQDFQGTESHRVPTSMCNLFYRGDKVVLIKSKLNRPSEIFKLIIRKDEDIQISIVVPITITNENVVYESLLCGCISYHDLMERYTDLSNEELKEAVVITDFYQECNTYSEPIPFKLILKRYKLTWVIEEIHGEMSFDIWNDMTSYVRNNYRLLLSNTKDELSLNTTTQVLDPRLFNAPFATINQFPFPHQPALNGTASFPPNNSMLFK